MDDYESRVDRIRTVMRACLDSHEEDEGFFSASDGGDEDSPPQAHDEDSPPQAHDDEDSPPQAHDDQTAARRNGKKIAAVDTAIVCVSPVGTSNDAAIAGGAGPSPHRVRGPSSRTEGLASTSTGTPTARRPHTGLLHGKGEATCSRGQTTEVDESNLFVAGRRDESTTRDDSAPPPPALTAATRPEPCGVVSFAGISVSGLRLQVKEFDLMARCMIVRASDQHGHRIQTAPRTFPRTMSLPSSDSTTAVGATRGVWCEELRMPVFPDVDGVLFELLLLATPRSPRNVCTGLQSTDSIGDSGSTKDPHSNLERLCTVKAANGRSERSSSVGVGETSLGESDVEGKSAACGNSLGGDRTADSRSCILVGAVALLLSEVVGVWRDMESPLFDKAGGVAGTIKLAARFVRGEAGGVQEADNTSVQDREKSIGGAEAMETAAHTRKESMSMAAGVSAAKTAAKAVASPAATSGPARSHNDDVSPVNHTAKARSDRRERQGKSAPTSPCCTRNRGSLRGGRGQAASVEAVVHRNFMGCTRTGGLEAPQLELVRADEMAPRAVIIYKGVKLPFRWFRSGTAKGIDAALRETLGINDASIASPLLYDLRTGDRVSLEPSTPSGRTFLAVLERHGSPAGSLSGGRSGTVENGVPSASALNRRLRQPPCRHHGQHHPIPSIALCPRRPARLGQRHYRHDPARGGSVDGRLRHQDQAPGRPPPPSTRLSPPNHPVLRRCVSAGDMCRCSRSSASTGGTKKDQAPPSPARQAQQFGARAARRDFAGEVMELQQQWHRERERERERLDDEWRQEREHAKAKAVACQLACRVLCRGHRTRVLVAALRRWRSTAAGLKMKQDGRDERRRMLKQAVALLELLRHEVASLTASTYEELVAVSIDALETDFHTPSVAETIDPSTSDPATESTPRDLTDREDEESVDRAMAELKRGISRLNELGAQKARRLRELLRERQGIQAVGAIRHRPHSTSAAPDTTAKGRVEARTPPLPPRTPTSFSPTRNYADKANPSAAQEFNPRQDAEGVRPKHRLRDTRLDAPPEEDQSSCNGACAGAVVDDSVLPSIPPSSPSKTGAAENKDSRETRRPHTAQGTGWGTVREPGSDDDVLEYFLARHAKEAIPPLGEGTGRQSPRRGCTAIEEGDLKNRAVDSERDAKVLWALFQAFSGSPPFSPRVSSPSPPPSASGGGVRGPSTKSDINDLASSGRVYLARFLEICRRAGLLLSAAKVARPSRRKGSAQELRRRMRGQETCWSERDGGRENERLWEAGTKEKVADPGETFFLLSPADAASVFERTARRYGSADAAVHSRTAHSSSPLRKQPRQQYDQQGHLLRPGRRQCPLLPSEEGLNFQQFVSAIGGVIELLTVGCNDDGAGVPRYLGLPSAERNSRELGASRSGRAGTPAVGASRRDGEQRNGGGGGGCIETYGGCFCSSTQRKTAMTPQEAKTRLVRLVKALAGQEVQARDHQARETLALLDPSVQSTLDVNAELLRKVFTRYCQKPELRSGSRPRSLGRATCGPRIKSDNDAHGPTKLSGGGGATRVSRSRTTSGLSFAGGKALATDLGLVASAQQLAEAWEVAWTHQRTGSRVSTPPDVTSRAAQQLHPSEESKLLSFSGFLDFLGRCALRFGQPPVDNIRRREGWADPSALSFRPVGLDVLGSRTGTGESVRTAAPGDKGCFRTGGSGTCRHVSSPAVSMLTLLGMMEASDVDGGQQVRSGCRQRIPFTTSE